ncbi:HAMP domain-containing sensor histidine kinase [Clostridium algidicarnis]|uniref:HAMP domain-containing sensor histidine kinase n=1 Tax=Clostridium algidicarnis TaxID=37659 RepID=UPI001C0B4849|nr:ATP-binding protein [Clostridium algidicarnis]MBU3195612.1 cell wall metabolism sensor histidine kinase WalK [Clostridium algidicarnis]MBU3208660.1 cell wall metabolism sensor histidine kinase WalK [Clostridium algidicarnis]MBU3226833.1 cell wall metabolism sensor histidine kinase WalK [Clostridium algidicarnis]MBU3250256.1 cell wall metabolism sensor histidine kinase WalK [Clostridium algidicarnis]
MKKKIMLFVLGIITFSLILVSSIFIIIWNYQYIEQMKSNLSIDNKLIANSIKDKTREETLIWLKESVDESHIRVTYIDEKGEVIIDTLKDEEHMDNHNLRKEVSDAIRNGEGYSVRYSNTLDKNMIYNALLLEDGSILRVSMGVDSMKSVQQRYLKYYILTLILVMAVSVLLSSKFSHFIVRPIEELQFLTSKVASGDLHKRVNILTNDEIGKLGRTFNDMADKLESTIKEAVDRQDKLEAILKSMDSGVIAVDENYNVIIINPYAKKIFGIRKNIIGENLMEHIRDFELENVFKERKDEYKEINILWPSEKELRIKTGDIISDGKLIGTVAVVQDITDLKKLENMRTQFVANVSHELKTPLTSIRGFAETLRYVDDDEKKDRFLNIINEEAERLTRLIEDILILSDIEQHKDEKSSDINVEYKINDIYYLMKSVAENKDISITLNLESGIVLYGNEDRFTQMMINLIDNAIKYSDKGSSVYISSKTYKKDCIIIVEDTGVGIQKEHIYRLFERFYRVDKARSRANGGTGLGLAIVKHIVLGFGGNIDVKSEVSKGSKFIITLPIKKEL